MSENTKKNYIFIPLQLLDSSSDLSYPQKSLLIHLYFHRFNDIVYLDNLCCRVKQGKSTGSLLSRLRELEKLGFLQCGKTINKSFEEVSLNMEMFKDSKYIAVWKYIPADLNLNYKALPLLLFLLRNPEKWVSDKSVGDFLGCDNKTLIKYYNHLIDLKYVEKRKKTPLDVDRFSNKKLDNFKNNKNKYILLRHHRCPFKQSKSKNFVEMVNYIQGFNKVKSYQKEYKLTKVIYIIKSLKCKRRTETNLKIFKELEQRKLPSIPIRDLRYTDKVKNFGGSVDNNSLSYYVDLKRELQQLQLNIVLKELERQGLPGYTLKSLSDRILDHWLYIMGTGREQPVFKNTFTFAKYMAGVVKNQPKSIDTIIPDMENLSKDINNTLIKKCGKAYSKNFIIWRAKQLDQFCQKRIMFGSKQTFIDKMVKLLEKEFRKPHETRDWDIFYDYKQVMNEENKKKRIINQSIKERKAKYMASDNPLNFNLDINKNLNKNDQNIMVLDEDAILRLKIKEKNNIENIDVYDEDVYFLKKELSMEDDYYNNSEY